MNRNRIALLSIMFGAAFSASAVGPLQFANITAQLTNAVSGPLATNVSISLYGVANDANSTVAAVGFGSTTIAGTFVTNAVLPGMMWVVNTNATPQTPNLKLSAVAFGGTNFVASGSNDIIFSSSDGMTWSNRGIAVKNTAEVSGIAFNSTNFVVVKQVPEIDWSDSSLANWQIATLLNANADPFESFRAVTRYGTNGFAACGAFEDIRSSTDAGATWQTNRGSFAFGTTNNLLGIAADDSNSLVSVGANGLVIALTNGMVWNLTRIPPLMNLNAVAYTGTNFGFITVGNGGVIFTSTNGANWNSQPGPVTTNLYGVTFARSGILQGVGAIVGAGGNVILVGTAPQAPTNTLGATNCATFPLPAANNPLFADVVTDQDHPPFTVAVDWYTNQFATPGEAEVATNTTLYSPPYNAAATNAPVYYTNYAQTRDLRTGFTSTNRTPVVLRINPRPTSTLLSLTTTNCNEGLPFNLTNVLTGIGPWTIVWSSNSVSVTQAVAVAAPGPYTNVFQVTPTNTFLDSSFTNIYFVLSVSNNGTTCTGNQPADISNGADVNVVIDPRPTSSLFSLTTTNCNEGLPFNLTNVLTGIGPWTVVWSSNSIPVTQNVLTNIAGPYTNVFQVTPTNTFLDSSFTNIYFVLSVSNNGTTCIGDQSPDISNGADVNVVINPRPTSSLLSLTTTNCNEGLPFNVTNVLTGIGPWTVVWSSNSVSVTQAVAVAASGPYTNMFQVTPTNTFLDSSYTNIYFVLSVSNNGTTCIGNQPADITNGADVNVVINPRPTSALLSLTTTNCNEGLPFYLTNVLTGIGPWTVVWSSNSIPVTQNILTNPERYWSE